MKEKEYAGIDPIINDQENYLKKELYSLIKTDSGIFNFLQEAALDGLWFWDLLEPENEWMNPKFWITLGYDPNEMPHKVSAWQDIIYSEDLKQIYANFARHAEEPSYPFNQIVRYKHKLGHTIWIRCRGIIIRDDNGKPVKMLGAHTDITDIKNKEEALRYQSVFFEQVIDGTGLGTWQWNVKTGETILNERWAEMIGYTLAELEPISLGTWLKYSTKEDQDKSNKLIKDHFLKKTPFYECEFKMKHKNGDWIWVLDRGKVVSWDEDGNPEWMVGSHQEITESKKAFEKNRLFIEQAPSAIAMFDVNMYYIAASQRWYEDYGISDESIIGKSHYEVFPEIGERWKADHKACLQGKVLKSKEDRFERLDGSIQWLTWELRPWYTDDNIIGGIIMHTADITRTKEAEIKLQISEEIFRRNFENAAIGMTMLNQEFRFTKVNYKLCEMLGYTNTELTSLTLREIIHPDDMVICEEICTMLFDGKQSYSNTEKKCITKTGEIVHVNFSTSIVNDKEGKPSYCIAQISNINHKISARQKLKEAITKLENIIDDITQISIIGTDQNGVITVFNKGAENLLGYSKEEIMFKESFDLLFRGEELKRRGKELSRISGADIQGFKVFKELLSKQDNYVKEWTQIRKDGTTFPVLLTISSIKENDQILGYLGVAADITEIKKAEKELKSLLKVAEEQNKRLRNFAHIVSHNLKSHSGNFKMLLDLLIQENPELENNEIVQLFQSASENLAETITHLNEVVLMNTSVDQNLENLNLRKTTNKIIDSVSAIANENKVCIHNKIDPDIHVSGIPAYLDSVLLNFITNGIKYRSDQRDSYISLRANQNEYFVELIIEDNGLGIDLKKHRSKLFGMYKTFHSNKEARGIGLFITKNQVEAMRGRIEVESKVNQGTTFKIYFKYEKN